jgi:hypothetical protein
VTPCRRAHRARRVIDRAPRGPRGRPSERSDESAEVANLVVGDGRRIRASPIAPVDVKSPIPELARVLDPAMVPISGCGEVMSRPSALSSSDHARMTLLTRQPRFGTARLEPTTSTSASAGMHMTTIDPSVRRLIRIVFESFARTGEWPLVETLRHELGRADDDLDFPCGRRGAAARSGQLVSGMTPA